MFYHADSGLYLTRFRAYDPGTGRWLSRDPVGEDGDPAGNLYPYVGGNPVSQIDPDGDVAQALPAIIGVLDSITGAAVGTSIGAALGQLLNGLIAPSPLDTLFNKPPWDAKDPNGAKAPGKPSDAEGFYDPKGGEQWVPNPNPGRGGSSSGWLDDRGRVWCPTGPRPGRAHGGPHWDVQTPGGKNQNVKPRENIND